MSRDSQYVHHLWHMEGIKLETACPKFEFFADFEPPEFFRPLRKPSTVFPFFSDDLGDLTLSPSPTYTPSKVDSREAIPSDVSIRSTTEEMDTAGQRRSALLFSSPETQDPVYQWGKRYGVVDEPHPDPRGQSTFPQKEPNFMESHTFLPNDSEEKTGKDRMESARDKRFDEVLALY